MTRRDKYEIARALIDEGATWREAAEIMQVSYGALKAWLGDPDGSKQRARREAMAGACVDCGAPTSNDRGPGKAHLRCTKCAPRVNAKWTHEAIVDAIQVYAVRYGRPPGALDWNTGMARRQFRDDLRDRFYADGCWPTATTVVRVFGRWNAAIAAAGFAPLRPGHKYSDSAPRREFVAAR